MPEIIIEPKDVRGLWTLIIYLIQHPRRILSAGLHLLLLAVVLLLVAGAIAWGLLTWKGIDPMMLIYSLNKTPLAGLVDFSRRSDSQETLKWARLANAKKEVFFAGVALHTTLGDHIETVRSNLQKHVSHKFLICDPEGQFFPANVAMFSGSDEVHRDHISVTLKGYETLKRELQGLPGDRYGTVEMRILDAPFPQACYFFDGTEPDGTLILVTRLPRLGAPEMPALVFGRMPGGLMDAYYTEWNKLWQKAVPVEDWLKMHPKYDSGPHDGTLQGRSDTTISPSAISPTSAPTLATTPAASP